MFLDRLQKLHLLATGIIQEMDLQDQTGKITLTTWNHNVDKFIEYKTIYKFECSNFPKRENSDFLK